MDVQRVICDQCGARSWASPAAQRVCAECGGVFRTMGPLEGLFDRWLGPPEQSLSEFYPRHLKLIELMWTANGRGRDTYEALKLKKVSYPQFVTRATRIVVRGLAEGWLAAEIPAAPTVDDGAYQIRFLDPDRWADALLAAFDRSAEAEGDPTQVDVHGDSGTT